MSENYIKKDMEEKESGKKTEPGKKVEPKEAADFNAFLVPELKKKLQSAYMSKFFVDYTLSDGKKVKIQKDAYHNATKCIETANDIIFGHLEWLTTSNLPAGMQEKADFIKKEVDKNMLENALNDFDDANMKLESIINKAAAEFRKLNLENTVSNFDFANPSINFAMYTYAISLVGFYLRTHNHERYKTIFRDLVDASNVFSDYFMLSLSMNIGRTLAKNNELFPQDYDNELFKLSHDSVDNYIRSKEALAAATVQLNRECKLTIEH